MPELSLVSPRSSAKDQEKNLEGNNLTCLCSTLTTTDSIFLTPVLAFHSRPCACQVQAPSYVISPYFTEPAEALDCRRSYNAERTRLCPERGREGACPLHFVPVIFTRLSPTACLASRQHWPSAKCSLTGSGVSQKLRTATIPAGSSLTTATAHTPLIAEGASPSKPVPAVLGKGQLSGPESDWGTISTLVTFKQ